MKQKIFFLSIILILALFVSANGSIDSKKLSQSKLGFVFSGNLDLINPLDPTHLKLKGKISLLNLEFEGDFDFEILSKEPLSYRVKSKEIKISSKKLIELLKKLNISSPYLNDIYGSSIIKNITLFFKDNVYLCDIGYIDGPFLWQNQKLVIQNVKIKFDALNKTLVSSLDSLSIGNSTIRRALVDFHNKNLLFKSTSIDSDIQIISQRIFQMFPNIKNRLIDAISKKNIPAVKDISLLGKIKINDIELKLVDIDKNATLHFLKCNMSTENLSTLIYTDENNKPIDFLMKISSSNIIWREKNIEFLFDNLNIIGKNVLFIKDIKEFNISSFFVPQINLTLNTNGTLDVNNGNLNLESKVNLNNSVTLIANNRASLELNVKPVVLRFKDNLFDMLIQAVDIDIKNITYSFSSDNILKLNTSIIGLKNIKLHLDRNKNKLIGNVQLKITNTDIKFKDINTYVVDLSSNTMFNDEYLTLKNGVIEGKLNDKGFVKLIFSSIIPIRDFEKKRAYFFENFYIDLAARDISFQDTEIKDLNVKKQSQHKIETSYFIAKPFYVKGNTYFEQHEDYIGIITKKVHIKDFAQGQTTKNKKSEIIDENKVLDIKFPDVVKKMSKKYHFEFDEIVYEGDDTNYFVDNVKGDLLFDKNAFLGFSGYFCNLTFETGAEFLNPGVNTFININGVSVPLENLIGCFVSRAPIYIKGETNIRSSIATQGKTIKEIKDNLGYDIFVTISNGQVLKLSNLGKKIEMILDILSFVRLNPSKLSDSLEFNSITGSISGDIKKANIKQIIVSSPVLNLMAQGNYFIDKRILKISGEVKKGWINKSFSLQEDLSKQKD